MRKKFTAILAACFLFIGLVDMTSAATTTGVHISPAVIMVNGEIGLKEVVQLNSITVTNYGDQPTVIQISPTNELRLSEKTFTLNPKESKSVSAELFLEDLPIHGEYQQAEFKVNARNNGASYSTSVVGLVKYQTMHQKVTPSNIIYIASTTIFTLLCVVLWLNRRKKICS